MDFYEFVTLAKGQDADRVARILARILSNLQGRSGFDDIFGNMDEDVVEEMLREMREIVVSEVTAMGRVIPVSAENTFQISD